MAIFPSSIISFSTKVNGQVIDASDINLPQNEITALETKVGIDNSADTTSLDYLIKNSASSGGGHVQTANKGGTGQTSYNKGDILVASSGSVLGKLSVGADLQVLTADSSQTSGVKWSGVALPVNIQNQTYNYGVGSVISASVYGVQITPIPSVLTAGQAFAIKFPTTNTSSIIALTVSSITAARILNPDLTNPEVGAIKASMVGIVEYDGTNFQLASNPHNVGTGPKQLVQLDGSSKLPAVDGSQLTNVAGSWILVSTNVVSAVSLSSGVNTKFTEFTSLVGDTDDEYLMEFELNLSAAVVNGDFLAMRFNDDNTASHYGYNYAYNSTGTTIAARQNLNDSNLHLAEGVTTVALFNSVFGSVKIKASKTIAGTGRFVNTNVTTGIAGNSTVNFLAGGGAWIDTTNQMTSIQLYMSQGTGSTQTISGKVSLYRIGR